LNRVSRKWYIDRALETPHDYANLRSLRYLLKAKPWQSVAKRIGSFFDSPHLRMAFSFQTLYLGISPFDCPAIYTLLPYLDLVEGVYYPMGGMSQITDALTQLFLDLGGNIMLDSEVEEIFVEDDQVHGVLLHSEIFLPSSIVISNVDLPTTYRRLLKNQPFTKSRRRVMQGHNGCSAAVFLWGIDQTYPSLPHHSLYLPMSFEKNLHQLFHQNRLPDDPAIYLCSPSKTDPTVSPPGCQSLMALVPVPNTARHDEDGHWISEIKEKTIGALQKSVLPGFSHHIVTEKILPPAWYARQYALTDAATFGLAPTFFQSAMFRHQRRSTDIQGLYFVGASAHPGNGVPIVLISARLAAEAVAEDHSKNLALRQPIEQLTVVS